MNNPIPSKNDFIIIEVTHTEIKELSFTKIEELLKSFLVTPQQYKDSVHIVFGGYDHVSSEIFEIKEIRNWVSILIDKHPELLFFLEEEMCGLQNMLLCIAENRVMKKLPNAVLSTPILENKVLVETTIPSIIMKQIISDLSVSPLVAHDNSILTFTAKRLKNFGIS